MLTITKQFSFCYGHHLPDYKGKCQRFHGHNSVVEVEVATEEFGKDYPGMVMDFSTLKSTVQVLIERLDHYDLNEVLPPRWLPPTAENMVMWLAGELIAKFVETPYRLIRVRMSETPTSWAEWKV